MADNIITPPAELFNHFKNRTKRHIELVQNNIMRFATATFDWGSGYEKPDIVKDYSFERINERGMAHDGSKFERPEVAGFVWLNSYYWLQAKDKNTPYSKDCDTQTELVCEYLKKMDNDNIIDLVALRQQLTNQFKVSFEEHYKSNRHHPEHYADISDMSGLDIIEMVCDWTAMSQELGQDNGSAKVWADKNIGIRPKFMFNEKQKEFIYSCIKFLDDANENIMFICRRGGV